MKDDKNGPDQCGGAALRDYLELMRLPNVFTSMADVAMGFLFVRELASAIDAWLLAVLLGASSLLYLAGVVLNDVFDLELDSHERPDRPLPSGRISPSAARRFGCGLLSAGAVLGWAAAFIIGNMLPGAIVVILVTSILIYDSGLKFTAIGPLLVGACRMFNVLLGMSAAGTPFAAEHWVVAGAIGLYIAGITWFARTENTRSSRLHLALSTIVMLLAIALLSSLPHWSERITPLVVEEPYRWRLLMLILGLIMGWRCLRAIIAPSPAQVQAAVAQSILSLIMLDAAACFAIRGVFWAAMILLLLLPAMFFGKWIELT
ncbi:MAG: UbiA family prenyltransferase [Thermoguttaceae bacterium]|jgi:4-hydroxybenzoate polyprenyltransferase